jgi:hypothetical protein
MVLPPPEGRYGIGGTMTAGTVGPQAEPPNTGGHPMVWIDNREFYGGHRDELVLTVRREP